MVIIHYFHFIDNVYHYIVIYSINGNNNFVVPLRKINTIKKKKRESKAALSRFRGSYEDRQFVPVALEHSQRIATEKPLGKVQGLSVTHFLLAGGQLRLFPLPLEKKGRAGTDSMQRVLIE